jgi:hypothetical protein
MRNLGLIELLFIAAFYGLGLWLGLWIVLKFYRALANIGEELRGIRAILMDRRPPG